MATGEISPVPGHTPQSVDEAMTWVEFDEDSGNLYAVHEVVLQGVWRFMFGGTHQNMQVT